MRYLLLIPLIIACTNTTSDPTSANTDMEPVVNVDEKKCAERADCGVLATGLFVHPGARDSQEELDFVKAQIAAEAEPWKSEFDRLLNSAAARRRPHGLVHINSSAADANTSRDDAEAAYAQALLWYYSGDDVHAERSIAILNSWATLEDFTAGSDQDKLQAGWIGAVFAPAAEIMRGYVGWADADIANFQEMFRRAFYPQLERASAWNGNVDLTQIDAMMAIAVFNEDIDLFNAGVGRWQDRTRSYFYLVADGEVPPIDGDGGNVQAFWSKPTAWVDGLTQETCRDNGHHAQFALGSALHAAEAAWHQGVDLYSAETQRYTAALELLATQLLSGDMQGTCADGVTSESLFDSWQVAYKHYHNRMGIELPQTQALIRDKIRAEAPRAVWNLLYETLTHTGLE
jgi:hypothetical protein